MMRFKGRSLLTALLIGLGTVGLPAEAFAQGDTALAFLYDNTVAAQGGLGSNWLSYDWYYPTGIVREFQVIQRRDGQIAIQGVEGTYTISSRNGQRTLCQQFDSVHRLCRPLVTRRVGDNWTETSGNGDTVRLRLIKGRMLLNFLSGAGHDTHIIAPFKYRDYSPNSAPKVVSPGAAAR